MWVLGRRPALDGLRGLAIVLVLCGHLQVPHANGAGPAGVAVFFTLSGFLITALLLEEHEREGRISFRQFYERRARRLAPALVLSTALVLALAPVFRPLFGDAYVQARDIPAVLLYYGNWIEAQPDADIGVLSATWSLAIEEQFYVVWPLVVAGLCMRCTRRVVMLIALAGATVSVLARAILLNTGASTDRIYFATDTNAVGLLLGCALAAWLGTLPPLRARWIYTVAGVAMIVISSWWGANRITPPIAAIGTALLLRNIACDQPRRVLEWPVMRWFGTRSYGIYLYHAPLYLLLARLYGWSGWALAAVVLPIALMLAEWSYLRIELPWRRRKSLHTLEEAPAPSLEAARVIKHGQSGTHPTRP